MKLEPRDPQHKVTVSRYGGRWQFQVSDTQQPWHGSILVHLVSRRVMDVCALMREWVDTQEPHNRSVYMTLLREEDPDIVRT